MSKWYHFDGFRIPVRISVYAVDENNARSRLKNLFKAYTDEAWTLHSATHSRNGAGFISRVLSLITRR